MTEHRDILDLVRRWIEKAEHDLINAQYTMTNSLAAAGRIRDAIREMLPDEVLV